MPEKNKKMRVDSQLQQVAYRKKIHIRLDDSLHQKLRVKVAEDGTTIQNYITELLRANLGGSPDSESPDKSKEEPVVS